MRRLLPCSFSIQIECISHVQQLNMRSNRVIRYLSKPLLGGEGVCWIIQLGMFIARVFLWRQAHRLTPEVLSKQTKSNALQRYLSPTEAVRNPLRLITHIVGPTSKLGYDFKSESNGDIMYMASSSSLQQLCHCLAPRGVSELRQRESAFPKEPKTSLAWRGGGGWRLSLSHLSCIPQTSFTFTLDGLGRFPERKYFRPAFENQVL